MCIRDSLLPYLDVPKDDPNFKVYQRIGATGIIKGIGMNVGWENQTWFFPDKNLSQDDMEHALLVLRQIKYVGSPKSLKNSDMIEWFDSLQVNFISKKVVSGRENEIDNISKIVDKKIINFEVMKRGVFAKLLDVILDPFHLFPIDTNGKFIKH